MFVLDSAPIPYYYFCPLHKSVPFVLETIFLETHHPYPHVHACYLFLQGEVDGHRFRRHERGVGGLGGCLSQAREGLRGSQHGQTQHFVRGIALGFEKGGGSGVIVFLCATPRASEHFQSKFARG